MSHPIVLPPPSDYFDFDPDMVPDVESIVIDDGAPVDNLYQGAQQRLLVNALYAAWEGPGGDRPWMAVADCGLFYVAKQPPLVPDVMLSFDVRPGTDLTKKENLSYFVWVLGKMPDVVIEVVSNKEGNEDTTKLRDYARLRIPYYVIHDPARKLGPETVRAYKLDGIEYARMAAPVTFPGMNLGVRLWTGGFEGMEDEWLRWTDGQGNILACGNERALAAWNKAESERQRADAEKERAEAEKERADAESAKAVAERQRADAEKERADRLAEMIRRLGGNPD